MTAHDDFLDPTLRDDPADTGKQRVWCEECGEMLTRDTECKYIGLDPDVPLCQWCCRCSDCASDRCSELHDASTRNDAP